MSSGRLRRLAILAMTALVSITSLAQASGVARQVTPLPAAHAHNDYEHTRPLFDALDRGFCSVEADIHLANGKILIGHNAADPRPGRTLEALYLQPLRERTRTNGGLVYPGGPDFTLLIDVKTPAEPTYAALRDVLEQYADILTEFKGDEVKRRAVTVVLSGNRPRETLSKETVRFAAFDGRLEDLKGGPSPRLMPWISDNWSKVSTWKGQGNLPAEDHARLTKVVQDAHGAGYRLRFWGTPDLPSVWRVLRDNGVDILGADDLDGLRRFLKGE